MPRVGYDLWYFEDTAEYGESDSSGMVFPLPTEVIFYKAVYLSADQTTPEKLMQARQLLPHWGNIYLLRPVQSSDGPPFRSVLIYVPSGRSDVTRAGDMRVPAAHR